MRFTSLALLFALLAPLAAAAEKDSTTTAAATPPPFFLQDATDSLCLAGENFKRCSIETLWYVVGAPGSYTIHQRPVNPDEVDEEDDDGMCLSRKSCKDSDTDGDTKVTKCSHACAKGWNIIGDDDSGYVLTQNDGKTCLYREKEGVSTKYGPCDGPDTPLTAMHLQFASPSDIATMASPGARLVAAATEGDQKAIEQLLKEGVVDDVNTRDWDGLTALIPAASGGHFNLVKWLVSEQKMDVNAADKDGITALMEASIMGHADIVDFLLANKADVNQQAESSITALWLAASEGKVDVMKKLLEAGADVTNTRLDGITVCMSAAAGGHTDAVALLLQQEGTDVRATDKDGSTALHNAAQIGAADTAKLLMDAVENDATYLDHVSTTGLTAMMLAAAHGSVSVVELLLDAGATSGSPHESNVTPLFYAAANGHSDVIDVLLGKGKAELEARHLNGGSPLLEAATGGSLEAIQALLKHGANADLVDDDGITPLMAIASTGNLEGQKLIVEALKKAGKLEEHLEKLSFTGGSPIMFAAAAGHAPAVAHFIELGAKINAKSQSNAAYIEKLDAAGATEPEKQVDGVTALHVAAQQGHLDAITTLLEAGADATITDVEGRSALSIAVAGNFGDVAALLVKHGADPNTVHVDDEDEEHNLLFDAIMVENQEFATLLVDAGADLYFKDGKSVTTLIQAAHRGFEDIVKVLVEAHEKRGDSSQKFLDAASDESVTALIAASSEGHAGIVQYLAEKGANINAKDQDETTAIMAASARGHVDVVKALLAAGAAVNEQNADGHSALMFAYNGKNQVETLFERYSQYIHESGSEKGEEDANADDDGGTGPLIREALDNHTALVDLLLKNGADTSLKDKEGHTAKDFDYHPDADSDILDRQAKAEKIRDESKYEL